MNFNAIIALLILKLVITEDEGERLVEHLNDKPQSTVLKDAIAAVAEVIGKPQLAVHTPIGPVGPAQQAEEAAARNAVADAPVLTEVKLKEEFANAQKVGDPQMTDPPSDNANEDKAATNEATKSTSGNKLKEDAKKK